MDYFESLKERLRQFAAERDWEKYHSPKNLAMALIVEAAELVEHFQWLTEEESRLPTGEKREEVSRELADILIYLVRLADMLEVDLARAVTEKIAANAGRYPPAGRAG